MRDTSRNLIRDTVYEILREKILTQEYKFGERLNIDSISQELEVSNNPIREALARLEKDGLIVMKPNVGSRVMEFSAESFRDLSETLEILLLGAFDLCIQYGREDELTQYMSSILDKQKDLLKKSKGQKHFEFAKAAVDFDSSFVKVSRNSQLIKLFEGLTDLFMLASVYDYKTREVDKEENIKEHQAILEAVKNKDQTLVQRLVKEHYDKTILFPQSKMENVSLTKETM